MNQVQKILMTSLVIIVIAGLFITFTRTYGVSETALFYIGLPAILAIGLIMTKRGSSPMLRTMKGITLGILLSGPILQEGFICMIMAAPIFYAVGALVAWAIGKQDAKKRNQLKTFAPFVILLLMSLEGTHPNLSFPRENVVTVSKLVNLSVEQLVSNLNQPVNYGKDAALFLKLFPFPEVTRHDGAEVGDRQSLHFIYRRHFVSDRNVHEGDIVFEITERDDTHIKSSIISDSSYLSTYMVWKTSEVQWQPINKHQTQVTWIISYDRKLDPAWYFGPLEKFVTELAAETLIDSVVASATVIPAKAATQSSNVIPAGVGLQSSNVIPAGAGILSGNVIPSGAGIPSSNVIPAGAGIQSGNVIPAGTGIPSSNVIPAEAGIQSGNVIPVGTGIPSSNVIPAEAGIQSGNVIPAEAGIQSGNVIPAEAGIQSGNVIPVGAGIQSSNVIPVGAGIQSGNVIPAGDGIQSSNVIPAEAGIQG